MSTASNQGFVLGNIPSMLSRLEKLNREIMAAQTERADLIARLKSSQSQLQVDLKRLCVDRPALEQPPAPLGSLKLVMDK